MKKLIAMILCLVFVFSCTAVFAEGDNKLRIITSADYPPFEYMDADGYIDGFDIAVIRAIMKMYDMQEGTDYTVSHIDFDFLLSELESGNADIVIAAMTINDERGESVIFSNPYFEATQAVTVAVGSDITCLADLTGKRIGVQQGTTGDLLASEIEGATIERYTKPIEAMMDLQRGTLDAVVTDYAPSAVFVKQLEGLTLFVDDAFETEYYGIAMRSDSTDDMELINQGIAYLQENDLLNELYTTYSDAE